MKNLVLSLGLLVFSVLSFSNLSLPAYAEVNVLDPACQNVTPKPEACQENDRTRNDNQQSNDIFGKNSIVAVLVRILAVVAGVASVIMIMIAGFKYIVSGGDPSKISSAKNTLLYAVIGVVITVFAQSIVIFVINRT